MITQADNTPYCLHYVFFKQLNIKIMLLVFNGFYLKVD